MLKHKFDSLSEMVSTYLKIQFPINPKPPNFILQSPNELINNCEAYRKIICDLFVSVVFFKILNTSFWGWFNIVLKFGCNVLLSPSPILNMSDQFCWTCCGYNLKLNLKGTYIHLPNFTRENTHGAPLWTWQKQSTNHHPNFIATQQSMEQFWWSNLRNVYNSVNPCLQPKPC